MYQTLPTSEPLSQGDIIDACPIFALDPASTDVEATAVPARWDMRILVLTQACDLAQENVTRVLVALVHSAESLVRQGALKGSTIRDRIRRGQVYGWYFLQAAPAPIDVPESIVDLHDLHTVPRVVLNHLIEDGRRVCRIVTPYSIWRSTSPPRTRGSDFPNPTRPRPKAAGLELSRVRNSEPT